jgi:hypothetical protein
MAKSGPTTTSEEEATMMKSKEAKDRAEAKFKKKEDRAREITIAMKEYEALINGVRERTARLKLLRLAKEAAEKEKAEADKASDR